MSYFFFINKEMNGYVIKPLKYILYHLTQTRQRELLILLRGTELGAN